MVSFDLNGIYSSLFKIWGLQETNLPYQNFINASKYACQIIFVPKNLDMNWLKQIWKNSWIIYFDLIDSRFPLTTLPNGFWILNVSNEFKHISCHGSKEFIPSPQLEYC